MAGKARLKINATHQFVEDPEVTRTLGVWVKLLAEALRKKQPAQAPPDDRPPPTPKRKRRPA